MSALRNVIPMTKKSPQVEDGHIRIANELFDVVWQMPFSHRQHKVIFAIIRKTYGFGKKEDDMSASQIGDYCRLSRENVTRTLSELEKMGVINKRPGVYGSVVGLNKDYSKWRLGSVKTTQECQNDTSVDSTQGVSNQTDTSVKTTQVDSVKTTHTKDNLPKDNKQKNCTEELSLSMQDDPREPTPIANLPLVDGSEHAVYESQAREWSLAYPAVDVHAELARMRVWLAANPRKRKTKRGVNAFVVSWLSRTQDRPRPDGPANSQTQRPGAAEDHFASAI